MKPELDFERSLVASFIGDQIRRVEWIMRFTHIQDTSFELFSGEKFALETLLQEIDKRSDESPYDVLENFIDKANESAFENENPDTRCTFLIAKDVALSILDGVYYDY